MVELWRASEIVWYWGGDRHLIQNSTEGKATVDCMGQMPSLEEILGRETNAPEIGRPHGRKDRAGEGIFRKIGVMSLCRKNGCRTRGLLPESAARSLLSLSDQAKQVHALETPIAPADPTGP